MSSSLSATKIASASRSRPSSKATKAPTSVPERNGKIYPDITNLDIKKLSLERHLAVKPDTFTFSKVLLDGKLVGFQLRNVTMLVPVHEDRWNNECFSLGLGSNYTQLQALGELEGVWSTLENYPRLMPDAVGGRELISKTKIWGQHSDCFDLKLSRFPPRVFDIKGEEITLADIKKFDHVDVVLELKACFTARPKSTDAQGEGELFCGWIYNIKQVRRIAHAEEKTDEDTMILPPPRDLTKLSQIGYQNGLPINLMDFGFEGVFDLRGRDAWTCKDCGQPGHASKRTRFCTLSDESLNKILVSLGWA